MSLLTMPVPMTSHRPPPRPILKARRCIRRAPAPSHVRPPHERTFTTSFLPSPPTRVRPLRTSDGCR
ncbi:uncharacterized protein SCHCODRAFT_01228510 [Schizophyllum commune H4-8]|uniref:uncharacterized protein n=1 Tax=Schizophyllum commune (strain H4-8 / FGSC 9210) TaxID=578458 RepID=UPI00215E8B8C|nr:uncharacterized protein SCHCODRAFT_01228510 [Schizophyllum commune H4-8]KAI5894420.1 hypothetical protein SCHCODRAFT_01228510 [Schizophyllum commune H4-8]